MPIENLKETPSQTAGPYVHLGTMPAFCGLNMRTQEKLHVLTGDGEGTPIRIEGRFEGPLRHRPLPRLGPRRHRLQDG